MCPNFPHLKHWNRPCVLILWLFPTVFGCFSAATCSVRARTWPCSSATTLGKKSCKFWHDSCMIFEPIRTLPVIFHVRCKTLHVHAWSCMIVRKSCMILARFSMILCKMACKIFSLGNAITLRLRHIRNWIFLFQ